MKNVAVYAGSFDPPTNGHLWVIHEALKKFRRLIIVIAPNADKQNRFSAQDRAKMMLKIVTGLPVEIAELSSQEFVVSFAKRHNVKYLVRGVRSRADQDYENLLKWINKKINSEVKTVFLRPPKDVAHISSSLVRSLVGPDGWVEVVAELVPDAVLQELVQNDPR